MRTALLVALSCAALAAACSSGGGGASSPADAGTVDVDDAAADTAPVPATWSAVYAAYFAAGTPGHCGNVGCHASSQGGFRCGATKDTCYEGLIGASLLDTKSPESSLMIDPLSSPLAWFGGKMPQDNPAPNQAAAAAVKAWVVAGAHDD